MKRTQTVWSNNVDNIDGACVVCGKDVHFVIPSDRPDPAILYHINCDVMPLLREQLKKATPPLLPPEYVIKKKAPAPAAVPAPAPTPAPNA